MTSEAVDFKILAGGRNWMQFTSYISVSLACYQGFLPKGSTVSITAGDPGSICMDSPQLIADGAYDIGITTPSWYGGLAAHGLPPFSKPLPVRALAALPHDDRLAFAVRAETGIKSFDDIRSQKYPLRIIMPEPSMHHPATPMIDEVLSAYGLSTDEILSWGGKMLSTERKRTRSVDESRAESPDWDAVFDEAIMTKRWDVLCRKNKLNFLDISPDILARFKQRGIPHSTIAKGRLPGLDHDVRVLDYSGWLMFCHRALPDDRARDVVRSLIEQGPAISASFSQPMSGLTGPIDPKVLCRDTCMPLHPGAEAYYKELGAL